MDSRSVRRLSLSKACRRYWHLRRKYLMEYVGDKLFVGTSTGNLHVYAYGETGGASVVNDIPSSFAQGGTEQQAHLVETKKSLCRRSIEQLAFIKDVNSLVVLSGTAPFRC